MRYNKDCVYHYGGEAINCRLRGREYFQAGVPGRADRAERECEGCGSLYTKHRRND